MLLLIVNCLYAQEKQITKDINTIYNERPRWENNSKIKLQFVRQYGGLEDTTSHYLNKPYSVAVDSKDNLYILDKGNYMIQKYDKNGQYIKSIGRRGQGPGEFQNPYNIEIDKDNNVYVNDFNSPSRGKILILNTDGRELRRSNIKDVYLYDFKITNSQRLVFSKVVFKSGLTYLIPGEKLGKDNNRYPCIKILTISGDSIKEFKLKQREKPYEDNILISLGHNIYYTIDSDDNVIVSFSAQNRIEKYSQDGNLILQISRNTGVKETDKAEIIDVKRAGNLISRYGIYNIFSYGVSVDSQNRIWIFSHIRQYTKEERALMSAHSNDETGTIPPLVIQNLWQFEVFDKNGVWLQKVTFDKGNYSGIGCEIENDRIFLIDSSNEAAIYEYKIISN
jgi:hypothetical protein